MDVLNFLVCTARRITPGAKTDSVIGSIILPSFVLVVKDILP